MVDDLLNSYKKHFNKFKACEEVGVDVSVWDELVATSEEFNTKLKKIHEEKAEEIKAALINKEDKSTAEIKLALELLLNNNITPDLKKKKKPGKHSSSLSGKEKEEWINSRKELIADE